MDASCWLVKDAPKVAFPEMHDKPGGRMQHSVSGDFQLPLPVFSARNENWPIGTDLKPSMSWRGVQQC